MAKIEIEIDTVTAARINWLSDAHQCTPQELIIEIIKEKAMAERDKYPFLGGWEKDADLVDQMVADIMKERGHKH